MAPHNAQSYLQRESGPLLGASFLLLCDVAISGSALISMLVCPIWFLASLIRTLFRLPGWKIGLARMTVPLLTLGIALVSADMQTRMATANSRRVIDACEQFHTAHGKYPDRLPELVPLHLPSIPRAKYCVMFGNFSYWKTKETPRLMWIVVPPFGKEIYNFEHRERKFLD